MLTHPGHSVQARETVRQAIERDKRKGGENSEEVGGCWTLIS